MQVQKGCLMTKIFIKCRGGLMLLDTGRFTFWIEVFVADNHFEFECLDDFATEEIADEKIEECAKEFPQVLGKSMKSQDFSYVEEFCEKWNLVKVLPNAGPGKEDIPESFH